MQYFFCHFWRCTLIKIAQILGKAKAQMFVVDSTNNAFCRQLAQTVNWKDAIDVLISVVMIVMIMRNHQLICLHITRDETPGVIIFYVWFLITQMNSCSADESEDTLFQFAKTRRVGDTPLRHDHIVSILPQMALHRQ